MVTSRQLPWGLKRFWGLIIQNKNGRMTRESEKLLLNIVRLRIDGMQACSQWELRELHALAFDASAK